MPRRDGITLAAMRVPLATLWNSFVMVGAAHAFLRLMETMLPEIAAEFAAVGPALGTPAEAVALDRAYASLPPIGFSERVLARAPGRFSVLRVKDVGWTDLGTPRRAVESARRRAGGGGGLRPVSAAIVALTDDTSPDTLLRAQGEYRSNPSWGARPWSRAAPVESAARSR